MELVLASRNAHKLTEIRDLLQWPGVSFKSLDDWPDFPDVLEDGDTFTANARKKAIETARHTGHWCLADDSGLEVDALEGAPGVYSARYAGAHGEDDANNLKVLADLEGVTDRSARFRCVLALAAPDGRAWTVDGTVEGHIDHTCRGSNGFGYDVLFVPEGYTDTFGLLDPAIKAGMSHRATACRKAFEEWADLFSAVG